MKKFLSCLGLLAVAFGMFSSAKAVKLDGDRPTFEVVLLGNGNSVQTRVLKSMLAKAVTDEAAGYNPGSSFQSIPLITNNRQISLHMFDTAGQERFQNILGYYLSGKHAVIMICDFNKGDNLEVVDKWMEMIDVYCSDAIKILVGSVDPEEKTEEGKTKEEIEDAQRKFEIAITKKCDELHQSEHFLVSPKSGEQICDLLENIGYRILDRVTGEQIRREREEELAQRQAQNVGVGDNSNETAPKVKKGPCLIC